MPHSRSIDERLPDWADFFGSRVRMERFEDAVRADFKSRGVAVTVDDGYVVPGDGEERRFGLSNLGQQCAQDKETEWPRLIREHFALIEAMPASDAELERRIGDFGAVRGALVVRLWEAETASVASLPAVKREVAPGLVAVLCLDLPDAIRTLKPEEVAAWDRSHASLFDEAQDNMERMSGARVEKVDLREGRTVFSVDGESFYIAPLALRLERFPETIGTYGTFVALPTRQCLLAVPFNDVSVLGSLSDMMFIASGMYRDGPGSVTARVYWVRDGAWADVPYEVKDGAMHVTPPEELVEALNEAPEESE